MKILNAFSTPISEYHLEDCADLNKALTSLVYQLREVDSITNSSQYSMGGVKGYHTQGNLLDSADPVILKFKQELVIQIAEYYKINTGKELGSNTKLFSWGIIYGEGAYSKTHNHPNVDIAINYYCKIPKDIGVGEGVLTCLDPRPAARWDDAYSDNEQHIKPKEGGGVIFPGWLDHSVSSHHSEEDRICIATNVFLDKGTFK